MAKKKNVAKPTPKPASPAQQRARKKNLEKGRLILAKKTLRKAGYDVPD